MNTIDALNRWLSQHAPQQLRDKPPAMLFLTGSSGCGKTHLARALEQRLHPEYVAVRYFDSIGVPSQEEIIATYGSAEQWQEAVVHRWVGDLAKIRDKALVIFEGQYHPRFIVAAVARYHLTNVRLAVVTADESVWTKRLLESRHQPELVTDQMRTWAQVLRQETIALGGTVIDTSASDLEQNLREIAVLIGGFVMG